MNVQDYIDQLISDIELARNTTVELEERADQSTSQYNDVVVIAIDLENLSKKVGDLLESQS